MKHSCTHLSDQDLMTGDLKTIWSTCLFIKDTVAALRACESSSSSPHSVSFNLSENTATALNSLHEACSLLVPRSSFATCSWFSSSSSDLGPGSWDLGPGTWEPGPGPGTCINPNFGRLLDAKNIQKRMLFHYFSFPHVVSQACRDGPFLKVSGGGRRRKNRGNPKFF